jgi:catechol 2,3-dioxygenase-like lactoylglutathione lyase family enzyme
MAWPPVIHAVALSLSRQTLDYAGGRAISAESGYSVKPALPAGGPPVEYGVVKFDHLTHWVPDLDTAMRDYQALGFTVRRAGQHPRFGLHNAGWRLDTRYIELIAVRDEAVARAGLGPGWPEIDATLRAGGGVEGFAVLVADIPATVADLRSRGIPVSDPQPGSIQRTNGSIGVWQRATLLDGPRWAPIFINYGLPIDEWAARFRDKGYPKDPWVLQGVTVEVPDPPASAGWLAGIFGLDAARIGQDAAQVPLPGCAITFTPGSADRITAVVLNGLGAPRGSVAGLCYRDTGS